MQQNKIFSANPFELVYRSPRETGIAAIWVSVPTATMNDNDSSPIKLLDKGYPAYLNVPLPSDNINKLYPVTNHLNQLNDKKSALMYIRFYTMSVQSAGVEGHATYTATFINNVLKNSLNSPNNAYNQGRIRLTAIPSHQPNWFRPKFVVNGNDYFNLDQSSGLNSGTSSSIFQPELAFGLNLPYEEHLGYKALAVYDDINTLEVFGGAYLALNTDYTETINSQNIVMPPIGGGNYDTNTYIYQKLPIVCEARFIVFD
jgi:hypothetical protein